MKRITATEKALIKLYIMAIGATILFGLSGLLTIILMHWLTRQSFAEDTSDKHGISEISASRMGGAAIFFGCLLALVGFAFSGENVNLSIGSWPIVVAVLFCGGLGLFEDLRNDSLSPAFRLIGKGLIFVYVFIVWPELAPHSLGVPVLDNLLNIHWIAFLFAVIFCMGFLNASNVADGANGLMPGIFLVVFLLSYLEVQSLGMQAMGFSWLGLYILVQSCALFLIFNVISGRVYLGDAGAYGLGCAAVLTAFSLYAEGIFSLAFLAVLFSYPCIELIVSMLRRSIRGRSLFLPDSDHLHNRVYTRVRKRFRSRLISNSLTGLSIALASSGVALAGYQGQWWPVTGSQWWAIFGLQVFLYGIVFFSTRPYSEQAVNAAANS